jgi:YD repeat-containing protein
MTIGRGKRSCVAMALTCALTLVAATAHGQSTTEGTDKFGVQPFHTYVPLESFEYLDPQTASITLTFTDLVLPGNRGRELRFIRTFNGALNLPFALQQTGWSMGLAGMVMAVSGSGFLPSWAPLTGPESAWTYLNGGPTLLTGEGGSKETFFMTTPVIGNQESQRWFVTADGLKYDQIDRMLYLRDSSVCHFDYPWSGLWRLTSCGDAFGTYLEVSYTPDTTTYSQHLGVGQTRTVVFNDAGGPLTEMTYNGQSWHFTPGAYGTTVVTPPVGPSWIFTYSDTGDDVGWLKRVQTPGGGIIDYTYAYRTYIHDPNVGPEPHPRFIATRTVSGPGVTTGSWTFDNFAFDTPASLLPREFTVTRPSGATTGFAGICSEIWPEFWIAGPGPGMCASGNDLRGVYHQDAPGGLLGEVSSSLAVRRRHRTEITNCEAPQPSPCSTHTTTYLYDAAGNVRDITEENSETPGQTRHTVYTFLSIATPTAGPHVIGLPTSETVTIGGETTARSWTYHPTTFFRETETIDGITTTFTPDAHGNVATATTAAGKVTAYTYDWGQVKTTQTAAHTISRMINVDGTIASETRAGRTTTFTYDALGRLRVTQGPGGTAATVIDPDDATGRAVTTTRGTARTRTTLDGFGRPILTETGDTNAYTSSIKTGYDAEGRKTFAGYPVAAGATPIGTSLTYDSLNRVRIETNPDGTTRERLYGRSTVTLRDEEDRTTVVTRQMFGHPDEGRITRLVDALGAIWEYGYHANGSLTSVDGPNGVTRTWTYAPTTHLLSTETHPESGTMTYLDYTDDGLVEQTRDARQTTFAYVYDGNNRLKKLTATSQNGNTQVVDIDYKSGTDHPEFKKVYSGDVLVVKTDFTYEPATGRLASRTDTVDGKTFATTYTYDASDNIASITYPSGRQVFYAYDTQQRLSRVCRTLCATATPSEVYAQDVDYAPSGALKQYRAGNGVLTTMTYHPQRQWLSTLVVGTGASRMDVAYAYDDVGNITSITDATRAAWTQQFDYDPLDRLIRASSGGAFAPLRYTYDAHGNRKTGGTEILVNGQPVGSTSFDYALNNLFRLQSINAGPTLIYDDNGNLEAVPGGLYAYTPTNQMSSATVNGTTTQYVYDADQWRVKKAVGSTAPVYFVRGPAGQLLSEWTNTSPNATVKDYIYAGGRLIGVATTRQPAK